MLQEVGKAEFIATSDAFIRHLGRHILEELKKRGLLSDAAYRHSVSYLKEM